ncbi:MAG: hypothetical protein DRJ05_00215 [Bacteroidetes bacterium]|nr:MAG: hypothetical protein DRI89_00125 [Bacteroidota bacterium]RLD62484.1 MAG: hypothetical protein DRJ05_00215 [Bacteroidota bacterium]
MKKIHLIFIVLLTIGTSLNAQWYELVTPTINYEIKSNSFIDLEINLDGDPYLLYNSVVPDEGNKLFVQKYDIENEEWSLLGGDYVNELNASDNHLAIDSKGVVYVAFLKLGVYKRGSWCTVMKFDGTDWVQIGDWNAGIIMSDVTMYCDNQDDVYVSYYDVDTYSRPIVKRYLGTESEWETVGNSTFVEAGQCLGPALTTDNDGNVLVSFGGDNFGGGLPLNVVRFSGAEWEYVGGNGIWDEPNYPTTVIVGKNNVIHTTTTDFWSLTSTVLNYQNDAWQNQFVGIDSWYMPFAKYNDDVYMGYIDRNINERVKVKKVDHSGNWSDITDQPGPYYTTPVIPRTYFDLEVDSEGNLYIAMLKGDQWNNHVSVLKLDVITGIAEPQDKTITIYPNPTSGIIHINKSPGEQIQNVLIVDVSGKLVFQQNSPPQTLDLSDLKKGIYFIRINTSKNNYIEKLLIR